MIAHLKAARLVIVHLVAALVAIAVSTAIPQTSIAQTADPATPAGIHSVYEAFSRSYETLDIDLLRAQYTEDCKYLPAGSGSVPVQTCEDAMAGFESMFASAKADGWRLGITFRFVDRSVSGDLAHDVGYYDLVSGPANKADVSADRHSYGKFVVVLKRGADGTWRIHVDGFSPTSREAYEQAASN